MRGKSAKTRSLIGLDLGRVGAREGAHLEVFEHGHAREEAPRLRHRRDAALDALGGRQVVDRRARIDDGAALRPHDAEDRLHRGRFAGGIAAEQADDLAVADPVVRRPSGREARRNRC